MYVYAYLCSICVRAEHAYAMECLLSEDNTGRQSLPLTVVKAGILFTTASGESLAPASHLAV